ncbi:MAG TPA: SDR family NAD(P)-dependent oxidoreductase, partial [Bacteroidales bacterium]|nr:SDR family NAD(P)-dependent oxidoreductase [Bacteroidales bacterium]
MQLLKDKKVLITGAARGIGKAVALGMAAQGADIAFTDLKIDDQVKETMNQIEAFGVRAVAYASDAASFDQAHQVVSQAVQELGRIDVLVNNAGITRDTLILRMSEQQWDMVIQVNLKSAFNFIHALAPLMVKQKGGSIINMSSVVGLSGNVGQANYSASKAGLIALTKSVAKELGPRGIRANAIAPGFIISDMTDQLSEAVRKA